MHRNSNIKLETV